MILSNNLMPVLMIRYIRTGIFLFLKSFVPSLKSSKYSQYSSGLRRTYKIKNRCVIRLCVKTWPSRDLEPKSYFWDRFYRCVPQVSVNKIVLIPAIGNFNENLRITDSNQTGRRHRMFWQVFLGHNTILEATSNSTVWIDPTKPSKRSLALDGFFAYARIDFKQKR